ncbi:MAG: YIP1 family protein [Clostridium sp.]
MFCSQCGTKINGDQKFCTNCGAAANSEKSESRQAKVVVSQNNSYQNHLADLMNIITDVIKKPLSSITNIEKFNQTMALIVAGIFIIATVVSTIVGLSRGADGAVSLYEYIFSQQSVGYASAILTSIITIAVSLGLMTLVLWLFTKQQSTEVSYGESFEMVMYSLIPHILIVCVCVVLNLIYPPLGVRLGGVTKIFGAILLYKLLRYKNLANQDKSVLIVLATMIFI